MKNLLLILFIASVNWSNIAAQNVTAIVETKEKKLKLQVVQN